MPLSSCVSLLYRQAPSPIRRLRPLSPVVVHTSNIFSGPIKVKFHIEPNWDGGTKVCANDPGQVTKMAAMLIYGKDPSKTFYSKTSRPMTFDLGILH